MKWLTFTGDDSNIDRFLDECRPTSVRSSLCEWIYVQSRYVDEIPDFTKNPVEEYYKVLRRKGIFTRADASRIAVECNVRYGKWLLHVSRKFVDQAWKVIARQCYDGLLGPCCKVTPSTGNDDQIFVICIYTQDFVDTRDVFRVRVRLDEFGFKERLPYKLEVYSKLGIYRETGPFSPSFYYE